jgi:hypothetical protein
MSPDAQRGQATVEMVGITVMVALLLAAASAWLLREARPPSRPPAFIATVSTPLVRDPGPFDYRYPFPGPRFESPRGRDDEPIGRVLRGARGGIVIGWQMSEAFDRGFRARMRERGAMLLDDPLGSLATAPDLETLTGVATVRQGIDNARRLWEYGRELRSMPAREAALRLSEDAGALAADIAIEAAKRGARKGVEKAGDRGSREP